MLFRSPSVAADIDHIRNRGRLSQYDVVDSDLDALG